MTCKIKNPKRNKQNHKKPKQTKTNQPNQPKKTHNPTKKIAEWGAFELMKGNKAW